MTGILLRLSAFSANQTFWLSSPTKIVVKNGAFIPPYLGAKGPRVKAKDLLPRLIWHIWLFLSAMCWREQLYVDCGGLDSVH